MIVAMRGIDQLLDRRAGTRPLPAGGSGKGKERVPRTKAISAAMVMTLLLSAGFDCVVANTTPSGSSHGLSGHTSGTEQRDFSPCRTSSTALHLSGGASVKRANKANVPTRKFRPRYETSSSARGAAVSTFVPPPPPCSERPGVGSSIVPHQTPSFVAERYVHHPEQQELVGPHLSSIGHSQYESSALENEVGDKDTKSALQGSASHQQQRLSTKALVFMGLLAIQFGMQPLLVRKFTSQGIIKSSVVLSQEAIKFAVASLFYLGGSSKEQREQERAGWSIKSWLAVAAAPAALYTVQNFASLLAYQNLEALTFNVLNQTKILSAAICCYLVMGKKQSRVQALSLLLLSGSALIIEKIVTLQSFRAMLGPSGGNGLFAAISKGLASFSSMSNGKRFTHGVLPVLLASFISGLAGALSQKNLQGAPSKSGEQRAKPRNAYLFSMEMNAASAIILLVSLLFSRDGRSIAQSGFFHNWDKLTLVPIVTNSLGGIVVGLVTKHAGSVQKGFALIFGLLLSGLIQVGSAGVSSEQLIGGALAAVSLWLHTTHPHKPTAKTSLS